MCRIFYNPQTDVVFEHQALLKYFTKLEDLGGRDGNGVYMMDDGLYKSLSMPSIKVEGEFMFHTRLGTHGLVKPYNCQPFVNQRYILVHNGVFSAHRNFRNFYGIKKKYSDTYVMFEMIKDKGIFNFYQSFIDSYYGVVLIHDLKVGLTYLLKTGGTFTYADFHGGYLYGTCELDFWENVSDINSFGKGMYILKPDEIIQIHKPTPVVYHSSGRGKYYPPKKPKDGCQECATFISRVPTSTDKSIGSCHKHSRMTNYTPCTSWTPAQKLTCDDCYHLDEKSYWLGGKHFFCKLHDVKMKSVDTCGDFLNILETTLKNDPEYDGIYGDGEKSCHDCDCLRFDPYTNWGIGYCTLIDMQLEHDAACSEHVEYVYNDDYEKECFEEYVIISKLFDIEEEPIGIGALFT